MRRNASYVGNLVGHFGRWQYATLARFRTLRQFNFTGADRIVRGQFAYATDREMACMVSHAVLRRAHLHDHIAATFQMIGRQPALASIHPAASLSGAARQGTHRRGRNGAKAHRAHIDHGSRGERLPAVALTDHPRWRRQAVLFQHRIRGIYKNQRAGFVDVVGRTKTDDATLVLGQAINPAAGGPVKGHFFPIVKEEILAEIFTKRFKEIAQMPDHREIAQD